MQTRFKMKQVQPAAYKPLLELENYLETTSIAPIHQEFIRIRASQINGCAYCVNNHSEDAHKAGETQKRINLISVWREAGVFTEEEEVILELTEQVTLISEAGISDTLYDKALQVLGEEKTAQVIMAAITINAWNRIGRGLNMKPL